MGSLRPQHTSSVELYCCLQDPLTGCRQSEARIIGGEAAQSEGEVGHNEGPRGRALCRLRELALAGYLEEPAIAEDGDTVVCFDGDVLDRVIEVTPGICGTHSNTTLKAQLCMEATHGLLDGVI